VVMIASPALMLGNSLAVPADPSTEFTTQWAGLGTFALAVINLFSRNDPGSAALRAVMVGNVVFHVLGIGLDSYGFSAGLMTTSGLVTGLIPHGLLALGFVYYLLAFQRHSPTV